MQRRIRATPASECDVFVVLRSLLGAPSVIVRKHGFIENAFPDFCFSCVVGAPLPVEIQSQRDSRPPHTGSGAALWL